VQWPVGLAMAGGLAEIVAGVLGTAATWVASTGSRAAGGEAQAPRLVGACERQARVFLGERATLLRQKKKRNKKTAEEQLGAVAAAVAGTTSEWIYRVDNSSHTDRCELSVVGLRQVPDTAGEHVARCGGVDGGAASGR
jgi:hypothetical protein